jgi:hypothetical protein
MTRDEISGREMGEIDPDVFSAYEKKIAPLIDQLSEAMEDATDEIMAEFDDPVRANDLFLMTCTHIVTLAVVSSQLRNMPMSVNRMCVAMARVLTDKGFLYEGKIVRLNDDCRSVIVPLEGSAARDNDNRKGEDEK